MFNHHPDGYFVIDGAMIDGAVFRRVEPDYVLPAGAVGRIYIPGRKHSLVLANGSQVPQPLDWPEGDEYIANRGRYERAMARQQARDEARSSAPTDSVLKRKVTGYAKQQHRGIFRGIG